MTHEALPRLDALDYGPAAAELIAIPRLCALGPGKPASEFRSALANLTVERLLAGRPARDRDMAACCLAGLWLRFDFLEESHALSQSILTPSGSYWHGIMHRREPDFSNAKYWFRQVGGHPVYEHLVGDAATITRGGQCVRAASFLLEQERWEAFGFVDLCQAAPRLGPPLVELCEQIQDREWRLLFDYCFRRA